MRNAAVGTVKKSIDTISLTWLSMKVRQVCEGGFLRLGIRRETVRSETSIPSLSSSPWIRGAPHNRLACAICSINAFTSESTAGRPPVFRRDSLVQNSRKPCLCHLITVSGLTIIKDSDHPLQIRDNQTQKRRSLLPIVKRFLVRLRTDSCCRRARFSRARSLRSLKVDSKKANNKSKTSFT